MSSFSLEKYVGKVAVVTGASAGIGKAITETLVKSCVKVAALARRIDRLEELAKELGGEKGRVYPFQCDLTREAEILETFTKITGELGPIHVLINNAGVARKDNIIDGNSDIWRLILGTNLLAATICIREAIRSMKENNIKGHIININSAAGHQVIDFPGLSVYSASKFGLAALTETVRLEINREKLPIKITSISPGYVKTEFAEANFGTPIDMVETIPGLESNDLADATVYVLSTPDRVNNIRKKAEVRQKLRTGSGPPLETNHDPDDLLVLATAHLLRDIIYSIQIQFK